MQPPAFIRTFSRWLWLHHPRLLVALWLLVQLWFLRRYHGPHFANDSARYLEYATNIAEHGTFERGHNLRYVLYPLFQSFWLRLGAGWWGIVLGQMAVAGLALGTVIRGYTERRAFEARVLRDPPPTRFWSMMIGAFSPSTLSTSGCP